MINVPEEGVRLGGRYQVIGYLGGGGFGQTYLAQDIHLPGQPHCVVKHLKPTLTDTLSLETAQRLFETEAQVLYKLSDYNQIPRLLAHFQENQEFYLVQEFIEGENLGKELVPGNRFDESETIALLQDILEVLVYIHHQNVIHRDLKPSNLIRRTRDGKIVLIDFGAVKQLSTQMVQTHGHTTRTIAIGSPGYMPSEQMAGRPRFCSDLYAAGMIGIQALTGLHPKSLPEDARTSELIWRDRAEVSLLFGDILDKMVRYDFRERYQSALDVLADLKPLAPERSNASIVSPTSVTQSGSFETRIQLSTGLAASSTDSSERGVDYKPLQDLLMQKAWQEADQETHRLMLVLCDQESGRLRVEDIRQFPCRDLYMLDYLWLQHSEGLFGFSVQRDIWKSVGGTTGAQYQDWDRLTTRSRSKWRVNSPWHRFATRVGWRVKDTWVLYDRFLFSIEAPKGHLPSPSAHSGAHIAALFSRMETCKPYVPKVDITRKF
ncbi:MAG: protein kinase [Cyanobacteria bacterium CRU_2_1]|nr:protein kinase [Cyanobacteria bacterium RU_5_0]NJR60378.1 protein kinase [Cyanobacteria bacterium CRU_2_1]